MSWNPFKKQQEPENPVQNTATDDDPTNPLVEAGNVEERVVDLPRQGSNVAYQRVELWDNGGLSSSFMRISVTDHGSQADMLRQLWLNLPEESTGFCDLLVNEQAALCAKFNLPDSHQGNGNGNGAKIASDGSLRPIELLNALIALATLLAQIKNECGWVWQKPKDTGFGWNTTAGFASGLTMSTVQFIAWDELGEGDENAAAMTLAAIFAPAFIELATQMSLAGFSFGIDNINRVSEMLIEAMGDPQLTYSSLADKLAALQFGFEMHGLTDTGRKRAHNEDAFLLLDLDQTSGAGSKFMLAAIADGMGGHASGEIASNLTLSLLRQHLLGGLLGPSSKPVDSSQLHSKLKAVIPSIDSALTERAAMDTALSGMGTTLVGVAALTPQSTLGAAGNINPPSACVFWVGDSRAYRLSHSGIAPLSKDHSYVQTLLDSGSITLEEARTHKRKNVITRCLGGSASADSTPDVEAFTPGFGELLLLCSDGLSDVLDDQQIHGIVLKCVGLSLAETAQALVDAANAGGGPDNITVVLVG